MVRLLVAMIVPQLCVASDWVQRKCKGGGCNTPEYPILDYNGEECVCRAHPCWNDNGKVHSCPTAELPFLTFAFHTDGTLICSCQKFPHWGSVYLAEDLCQGGTCESEATPILEYKEEDKSCVCSTNPCSNDAGMAHTCDDPDFPILMFNYDEEDKLKCFCSKKWILPEDNKEL